MPLLICSKCGCVDNTAVTRYWTDCMMDGNPPLCSECDPQIGKWHGLFAKEKPTAANWPDVKASLAPHHPAVEFEPESEIQE